jgi:hypothetical protein
MSVAYMTTACSPDSLSCSMSLAWPAGLPTGIWLDTDARRTTLGGIYTYLQLLRQLGYRVAVAVRMGSRPLPPLLHSIFRITSQMGQEAHDATRTPLSSCAYDEYLDGRRRFLRDRSSPSGRRCQTAVSAGTSIWACWTLDAGLDSSVGATVERS